MKILKLNNKITCLNEVEVVEIYKVRKSGLKTMKLGKFHDQ